MLIFDAVRNDQINAKKDLNYNCSIHAFDKLQKGLYQI